MSLSVNESSSATSALCLPIRTYIHSIGQIRPFRVGETKTNATTFAYELFPTILTTPRPFQRIRGLIRIRNAKTESKRSFAFLKIIFGLPKKKKKRETFQPYFKTLSPKVEETKNLLDTFVHIHSHSHSKRETCSLSSSLPASLKFRCHNVYL